VSAKEIEIRPLSGVSYDPQPSGNKSIRVGNPAWRVRLYYGGKETTLGRFETVEAANDAVTAYKAARAALVIVCDPKGRCVGCKGLRMRSAEYWLTA
jgi:hypothetical protein